MAPELGENVSRTEVLFNGVRAIVQSWTDTEIKVKIPHRHSYGVGKLGEFNPDLTSGPLVVRRGSWDLLPDGSCCTPKMADLGSRHLYDQPSGLPDASYWRNLTRQLSLSFEAFYLAYVGCPVLFALVVTLLSVGTVEAAAPDASVTVAMQKAGPKPRCWGCFSRPSAPGGRSGLVERSSKQPTAATSGRKSPAAPPLLTAVYFRDAQRGWVVGANGTVRMSKDGERPGPSLSCVDSGAALRDRFLHLQ